MNDTREIKPAVKGDLPAGKREGAKGEIAHHGVSYSEEQEVLSWKTGRWHEHLSLDSSTHMESWAWWPHLFLQPLVVEKGGLWGSVG